MCEAGKSPELSLETKRMEEIPTFPCFDTDATLQQMLFRATRINPTHISNLLDKRRKGKALMYVVDVIWPAALVSPS